MVKITEILVLTLLLLNTALVVTAAVPPRPEEIATVEGFRSAQFGMTEDEIYNAIKKDFDIPRKSVERTSHPIDKTTILTITVTKLIREGGQARVFYILGYRNKKLIQTNVIWGNPFDLNPNPQRIMDTANVLRNHFFGKGFKQDNLLLNARLKDGSLVVFRGTDAKGRMVFLLLKTPSKLDGPKKRGNKDLSLRLSYIENPNDPDIFKIKEGEF